MDRPGVNDTTQRLSALETPYRSLTRLSVLNAFIDTSGAVA